tara:strand:- start:2 stop:361 length:360 start_codon:yes stop_codon:yes gene_type:complete
MKLWKPKFIENSRVPGWLSKVAPINIWAISLGPFVWCKGDLSEKDKIHETIHYQQQLELLIVGQWLLYFLFWFIGVVKYRNGAISYLNNPFEIEAYTNETDDTYLITRKRYAWIKYVIG